MIEMSPELACTIKRIIIVVVYVVIIAVIVKIFYSTRKNQNK